VARPPDSRKVAARMVSSRQTDFEGRTTPVLEAEQEPGGRRVASPSRKGDPIPKTEKNHVQQNGDGVRISLKGDRPTR